MTRWISDEQAEAALEWLRSNARALGDAKEEAVKSESMRKRVRSIEMQRSEAKTVSGKEQEAEASQAYLDAVLAEAKAAGEYEYMRALKDAAVARIECWRSLRASERALAK